MSVFNNVTVVKDTNVYFDGNVTSRSIVFPDGSKKTPGIMLPGEYEFNTDAKEIIDILSGELDVLLPQNKEWTSFRDGDTFEVSANAKFQLKVKTLTNYCCSFIK